MRFNDLIIGEEIKNPDYFRKINNPFDTRYSLRDISKLPKDKKFDFLIINQENGFKSIIKRYFYLSNAEEIKEIYDIFCSEESANYLYISEIKEDELEEEN